MICIASAGAASGLETARSLAASGAPHLALARVEQLQPRDSGAPRWAEWEALRLDLLVELKRHAEALERAAALPKELPQPQLRQSVLAATRAAVAAGQGARARALAARLLWQLEPMPEEARAARLLVIESYLAERQGETAFRAMLRFDQDYRPLERDVAERFVGALLDLGLDREAINWLAALDDAGALKLRLRLRGGLVAPEAAIARARARLAAGGDVGYWRVLAEAAARQGNALLRIETLEQLLNRDAESGARSFAGELWQAYLSEAQAAANANGLLAGDDAAWLDFAARRLGSGPQLARALFGHVARNGVAREIRQGAQLQLVLSLRQSGLDYVALRLFGEERAASEALDAHARYLLGSIAESRHAPALALRFWDGLGPPPDAGAEEWQARLALQQWNAGMADASLERMRTLARAAKPLPDAAAGRALVLVREMIAAGKADLAQEVLSALLPLSAPERAREMLYALGGIAESAGQHARAANYFLRAALASDARAPDALALRARLAAAMNLARAGYREDARAQFQWLLDNSRDAAQREIARRELARY